MSRKCFRPKMFRFIPSIFQVRHLTVRFNADIVTVGVVGKAAGAEGVGEVPGGVLIADIELGEFSMVSQPIRSFWLIGSSSIFDFF